MTVPTFSIQTARLERTTVLSSAFFSLYPLGFVVTFSHQQRNFLRKSRLSVGGLGTFGFYARGDGPDVSARETSRSPFQSRSKYSRCLFRLGKNSRTGRWRNGRSTRAISRAISRASFDSTARKDSEIVRRVASESLNTRREFKDLGNRGSAKVSEIYETGLSKWEVGAL